MEKNKAGNLSIGQILQSKTSTKNINGKNAKSNIYKENNYEADQINNEKDFNKKKNKNKSNKNIENTKPGKNKWRKWLKIAIAILLVVIILSVVFIFIIDYKVEKTGKSHLLVSDKTTKGDMLALDSLDKDYDCVIVPGARVFNNTTPSLMLQDRMDVAFEIYNRKIAPKILVSGDHGTKEYDEVNVMRDYLISKGVPTEDIFMDHAGFDTYQTIYRARDIFQVRKAIITTQDFHLYRALYIGEKLSTEKQTILLDGLDSALRDYQNSRWNRCREYLARVKAFLECEITKPEPQYLGDVININGDGNQTVDK